MYGSSYRPKFLVEYKLANKVTKYQNKPRPRGDTNPRAAATNKLKFSGIPIRIWDIRVDTDSTPKSNGFVRLPVSIYLTKFGENPSVTVRQTLDNIVKCQGKQKTDPEPTPRTK